MNANTNISYNHPPESGVKTKKMKTCENCGCRVYSNGCINCNEELYILDQYHEQDMELPDEDTEFMKKADEQRWQMEQHLQNEQWESNMRNLYTYDEDGFCDGFTNW